MSKNNKISQLSQTHGKIEKPVTLDQIWGDTGINKYGTLDPVKYDKYVNDLNKSDLQAHAVKIGLVPIDDRSTLISRLKREFNKHASTYKSTASEKKELKLSKKSKDTLSEGR
jgi:hypothetical protein